MTRPLDDPRVSEVVERAPVLYTAVDTGRGLHATPTAFSYSGGAFWLVAPRESVKVRALRRRPRVGLLLRSRRYDLVAIGHASIIDPIRGRGLGLTSDIDRLVDLPFAALGYFGTNTQHVLGILRDADLEPGLLLDRTAVRIHPDRIALLRGPDVLATWGGWTSVDLLGTDPPPGIDIDPAVLPERLRPLLREPGPACLAWPSVHGPTALPACWTGTGGLAHTSTELMTLIGGHTSGPAALTISTGGYRLNSKAGIMLRGQAHAGPTLTTLNPQRITYWQGDRSATVPIAPHAAHSHPA